MPPKPDADIAVAYLCFIFDGEPAGWTHLDWDGEDFKIDGLHVCTEDVTHWAAMPPDPKEQ